MVCLRVPPVFVVPAIVSGVDSGRQLAGPGRRIRDGWRKQQPRAGGAASDLGHAIIVTVGAIPGRKCTSVQLGRCIRLGCGAPAEVMRTLRRVHVCEHAVQDLEELPRVARREG